MLFRSSRTFLREPSVYLFHQGVEPQTSLSHVRLFVQLYSNLMSPFFVLLHGMWPYVFMAWYLAKNKTKQKQGKPYADFWISFSGSFLSVLCLAHSHQLRLPDLKELSLHLSDTVALCLGSPSWCDCQKVAARRKAASSRLYLIYFPSLSDPGPALPLV